MYRDGAARPGYRCFTSRVQLEGDMHKEVPWMLRIDTR